MGLESILLDIKNRGRVHAEQHDDSYAIRWGSRQYEYRHSDVTGFTSGSSGGWASTQRMALRLSQTIRLDGEFTIAERYRSIIEEAFPGLWPVIGEAMAVHEIIEKEASDHDLAMQYEFAYVDTFYPEQAGKYKSFAERFRAAAPLMNRINLNNKKLTGLERRLNTIRTDLNRRKREQKEKVQRVYAANEYLENVTMEFRDQRLTYDFLSLSRVFGPILHTRFHDPQVPCLYGTLTGRRTIDGNFSLEADYYIVGPDERRLAAAQAQLDARHIRYRQTNYTDTEPALLVSKVCIDPREAKTLYERVRAALTPLSAPSS
ncbi:MAG: hypothetical protein V1735_00420 [Nanoarchaeota archaeon]